MPRREMFDPPAAVAARSNPLPLADRTGAGQLLAARLEHLRGSHPVVLALPRGGVPVAYEIARALDAELELLMVRKMGAPHQAELAIGAVVDGEDPQLILNEDAVKVIEPSREYVQQELSRQLVELERRRRAYVGTRPKLSLAGRTVIIVDDGIATGSTMTAALRGTRGTGPRHLVLAVPIAPPETIRKLAPLCDEVVVLAMPDPFVSVGQHYRDFRQVEDGEVIALMGKAEAHRNQDA